MPKRTDPESMVRDIKRIAWGRGSGRDVRYSQSEKMQVISLVEESPLPVRRTLAELNGKTFYKTLRTMLR